VNVKHWLTSGLGIAMVVICSVGNAAERPRTWRVTGEQPHIKATLVAVDDQADTVTIALADGGELEFATGDLSLTDRRYVARAQRRMAAQKPTTTGNDSSHSRPNKGILWHSKFASASKEATGNTQPNSARPILCFRVLGELDGFM
jgi:hypothetical protein